MKLFEKTTKIVPRTSSEREALLEKLNQQGIDYKVKNFRLTSRQATAKS